MPTNAQLAQQVATLIERWEDHQREFAAWLNGAADAGPFFDGRYPLRSFDGAVRYVECPAKMAANVTAQKDSATEQALMAAGAAGDSLTSATRAEAAEGSTLTYRSESMQAKDEAAISASAAANAATNAAGQAWAALQNIIQSGEDPPPAAANDGELYLRYGATRGIFIRVNGIWEPLT